MTLAVFAQYVIAAVTTTAEGTVDLLYAPYLDGYGYSLSTIGSLSALFAILRLASRIPTGAQYRPSRARRQLAFWLVVFTLSTSGFAFARGDPLLVTLLTIAHGYAFGAVGTLNLAIVIDLTGGRRAGVIMGWYTAALSTGYAIGAFAGGALADAVGIPATLAVLGALPAVFALATPLLPRMDAPEHELDRPAGLAALWHAHRSLDPRVWVAFAIVLYINVLSDSIDRFFPLFGLAVGLPLAANGFLKGLKSGSATFIRFVSGGVFRYLDYRTINVWGVVVMAAAMFLVPLAPVMPVLVVLFVVSGLCRGLLRVTSAATVAELRNEGRDIGPASAVYNAGLDIGAIVGPAAGGVIAELTGVGAMFQVLAALTLAGYGVVALASARRRAAGTPSRPTAAGGAS